MKRPPLPPPPDDRPGDPLPPLDDDEPDELPLLEDVPDDPGGDWLPEEPREDVALPDLRAPDDADDGSWAPDPEPPAPDLDADAAEPPVLSWRETARLPLYGVDVPAILDPTAARSVWIVPPDALPIDATNHATLDVVIGPLRVRVSVEIRVGPEPVLRLGRDALAGRVLVRA